MSPPRHPPARVEDLHVGVVTGREVAVGADGSVHADAGLGKWIDELAGRVGRLSVAAARPDRPTAVHDHEIVRRLHDLVPLPVMSGFPDGLRKTGRVAPVVRDLERRCDVLLVQLAIQSPFALLPVRGPRVYHVYGDVLAMARVSDRYRGVRRVPARALAVTIDRVQRRLVHRPDAALVANGDALLAHYRPAPGRGQVAVSSTIYAADLSSAVRARPPDAPFRVLFVGFLRPEKALDTLLDGYVEALATVPEAELRIVGPGALEDLGPVVGAAWRRARREGRVEVVGHVPAGPALYQEYADADVLALPSRTEGTPRVLVEARAFGCPVVASRVGGVPTSVRDGMDGLLVPPDDPTALATALVAIATDPGRRAALVAAGKDRARRSTVEAFVDHLVAALESVTGCRSVLRDDGTPRGEKRDGR